MSRYDELLHRLSTKSVERHHDAYADIEWDAWPIEGHDPRWALSADDPLGGTAWYRGLPEARRAALGLDFALGQLARGVDFENILSRGLLRFAMRQADPAAWRYAMHEVIEEGQHQLMFREFIRRSGRPARGLSRFEEFMSRRVVRYGATFPELFFVFVLGGEAPIDHVQRQALRAQDQHPLLKRVMRIHVMEEARHLCFAQAFLRERVPALSGYRRARLAVAAPLLVADMARQMLRPNRDVVRRHGIPRPVLRGARARGRGQLTAAVAPIRGLCEELGLVRPAVEPLWHPLAPRVGAGC